jgi:hypothetical protein
MINDPSATRQFDDQTIQDQLDQNRDDIYMLPLDSAPLIVNAPSTNNVPSMIFADFYSTGYEWWEADVVLQGNSGGQAWIPLAPVVSEPIVGHWAFERNTLFTGTFPGQYPPVFCTGKIYDIFAASADLLEMKATALSLSVTDFSTDGQSFKSSQIIDNIRKAAMNYRRLAKPKNMKMVRRDVAPEMDSKSAPVLGGNSGFGGLY